MRYFGGKGTIADQITAMINQWMKPGQEFLEPFVGSAWIVRDVKSKRRFASDTNPFLIAMYKALQEGWIPPTHVSEAEYADLKRQSDEDISFCPDPALVGFVGHFCSFGGMWYAGMAKDSKKNNYVKAAAKNVLKMVDKIWDVDFHCMSYDEWMPEGAFVYCDPPYADTGQEYFSTSFDSEKFWNVMRQWSERNIVIISEYKAPDDFPCIAEYRVRMKLNSEMRTEKVFSQHKYDPFGGIF